MGRFWLSAFLGASMKKREAIIAAVDMLGELSRAGNDEADEIIDGLLGGRKAICECCKKTRKCKMVRVPINSNNFTVLCDPCFRSLSDLLGKNNEKDSSRAD